MTYHKVWIALSTPLGLCGPKSSQIEMANYVIGNTLRPWNTTFKIL